MESERREEQLLKMMNYMHEEYFLGDGNERIDCDKQMTLNLFLKNMELDPCMGKFYGIEITLQ